MTEVRQCWAYSTDGMRCEHPAGHPGSHIVEFTWDDDECAVPVQNPVQVPATPPSAPPQVPDLVATTVKCVACQHQHKGGPCKCGCHEFIG